MIATLSADLVEGSRARIDRWLETANGVTTPDEFYARRDRLPADLVGFTEAGTPASTRSSAQFVYRHIIHSFPVSRHDGHARRVLAAIFAAYRENPRLLPDDVLRGMERELSVPLSPGAAPRRSAIARSRGATSTRPGFYRAIADHIAGMTDSYCNTEYRELVVE